MFSQKLNITILWSKHILGFRRGSWPITIVIFNFMGVHEYI